MILPTKKIDFFMMRLLVIFIPFMFHLDTVIYLNVSFSDIVLAILLFWILCDKENRYILTIIIKKYCLIILYVFILIYFCVVSMVNFFTNIYLDFPYGVSAILKLSFNLLYVVVFLIYLEKYKEEIVIVILRSWKFAASIISLLCIASVILYRVGIDNGFTLGGRAQATLNDPNMAALYLIVSFSVISLLTVYLQKGFIINFSMILILISIFLTASRGGILSIGLGFLFVLFISFLSGRIKELFVLLTVSLMFFIVLMWVNNSSDVLNFAMERVSQISTEEEGTSRRLFLWNSAIEMWEQSPFIGVGVGQFMSYSPEVVGYTISNIAHNTYLTFLAETGIFGFIAFVWFPVYLLFTLTARLLTSGSRFYFYLLIGLVAILIQALSINVENIRFVWIFFTIIYFVLTRFSNNQFTYLEENMEGNHRR